MNNQNLPKNSKINWKYILIVVILAILGLGIVIAYSLWINREISVIKFPEVEKETTNESSEALATEDWKIYRNEEYGFEVKYPQNAEIQEKENWIEVDLPFATGTKLEEKHMRITVKESTIEECFGSIKWHGLKEINGIEFHYIPGFKWEHAMGGLSFYASEYFTVRGNKCYMIAFRIGVRDPTGFVDPSVPILPDPPEEDLDTTVFEQMLSTFRFLE